MTTETQQMIDKLMKRARYARAATNVAQRDAAQGFFVSRASELRDRRDVLADRLERRWAWLEANDPRCPYTDGVHTDQFLQREARTIVLLHELEAIEDALATALTTWTHGAHGKETPS